MDCICVRLMIQLPSFDPPPSLIPHHRRRDDVFPHSRRRTTMASATTATLRFGHPDLSVPDEERSFLSFPAPRDIVNVKVELNDASKDPDIVPGPKGLDVQGFAYVKHHSSICDGQRVVTDHNAEETYFPEMTELICKTTGAKEAIVVNCVVRAGLAVDQENHSFVNLKGGSLDRSIAALPRDVPLVAGRNHKFEPNRKVHIDYSMKGVREAARSFRKDIKAMAQEALDAEDAGETVPRYAIYSMWRPLKTVKRDPLVICDWRTVDQSEVVEALYRSPSEIRDEYMVSACMILPPKDVSKQKWYWLPQQTPEDVLVIKIGDTEEGAAGGCPHVSPIVHGTEDQEARSSVEVRVLAFW